MGGMMASSRIGGHRTEVLIAESTRKVLEEIACERIDQDDKWGEQNHPDGTGPNILHPALDRLRMRDLCKRVRDTTQFRAARGRVTFLDVLFEEVAEVLEADDPVKLREELIQVAAVATCWVESIDRRPVAGT